MLLNEIISGGGVDTAITVPEPELNVNMLKNGLVTFGNIVMQA